jgi:hypothetical protein
MTPNDDAGMSIRTLDDATRNRRFQLHERGCLTFLGVRDENLGFNDSRHV